MVTVESTSFAGWEECLRVSNGTVELVAPTDIGPRIMSFGFVDGRNLLYVDESEAGLTGDEEFRFYGGHRLWHAPEAHPRTYQPENDPVEVAEHDAGVTLSRPANPKTGIAKEVDCSLAADDARLTLTHRLRNEGLWPVEAAPWGITQLAPDATGVLPLSPGPDGYLPDRSLALWPYTALDDARLTRQSDAVWVDHDADGDGSLKVGASGADEWIGAVSGDVLFQKRFDYDPSATYPDRGSAIEIYTDADFLEVETLGPLATIDPDETVEHVVEWELDRTDADDRATLLDAFRTLDGAA